MVKAQVVHASDIPNLVERIIALRDPALAALRRKNTISAKRKGRPIVQHPKIVSSVLGGLNRSLNEARVDQFAADIVADRWWFTPDPIVISDEGYILNGQHRLAAVLSVKFDEGERGPEFLVVWGVDKRAALLMDEARRSTNDRRDIALKFAAAV